MTSPTLTEQTPRIDPVEALRVLMSDLQGLAQRLGLGDHNSRLQQTLNAAQARVNGPRAIVMLLGEDEGLKRQFLERLLGPDIARVPRPANDCVRLEYGAEAECTVQEFPDHRGNDTSGRAPQTIRLPNPALRHGLALVDTPLIASGEVSQLLLETAAQADAWILVLGASHTLSENAMELLRQLPEHGARLELIVEGADGLSAAARTAARELLMRRLREECGIDQPRLTLVATAATEGDEENYWHGRFATFHSVMTLRGREHWLEGTRAIVNDALCQTGTEIECELKSIGLGLRHARLRMGWRDLEGLRTRYDELGRLDRHAATDRTDASLRRGGLSPDDRRTAATAPTTATRPSSPTPELSSIQLLEQGQPEQNGHRIVAGEDAPGSKPTLRWRVAGLTLAGVCCALLAWAVWPHHGVFGDEFGANWRYEPAKPAALPVVPHTSAAPTDAKLPPVDNATLPAPAASTAPNIPAKPLARARGPIRTPLARPIPTGATAGAARERRKHHHDFLGLGKLWHWVRHSPPKTVE